ncbi:MAG: serine protease [Kofleriaceae bacterium]
MIRPGAVVACLPFVTTIACSTAASPEPEPGPTPGGGKADVWGTDDRSERYEYPDGPIRAASLSSAALIRASRLVRDSATDTWSVPNAPTLKNKENLCDGERFEDQPTSAGCSATLIDDDILLTAGHCYNGYPDTEFAVVFDVAYEAEPDDPMDAVRGISSDRVYHVTEVLSKGYTVDRETETGMDYAVIRVDRAVTGRSPAPVNWSGVLSAGQPLHAIGHPSGLPQKISSGVALDVTGNPEYVIHDADVFGGSSGCGVFDDDGVLVGIHVRSSARRYIQDDDDDTCYVVAVCGDNVDCHRKPHAYDPRALKDQLSAELKAELGVN